MDKFSFISLWDAYQGLLTDYQREITDMYFNMDLTLSEIAEEKGITRQAVSECMKTCKAQLCEYEEKLRVLKRLFEAGIEQSCRLTDISRWADDVLGKNPALSGEIAVLKEIINKDYTEEASAAYLKAEADGSLEKDYTAEVYGHKKTGEE